jgi:uncharacterized protein (UPF0147 family)
MNKNNLAYSELKSMEPVLYAHKDKEARKATAEKILKAEPEIVRDCFAEYVLVVKQIMKQREFPMSIRVKAAKRLHLLPNHWEWNLVNLADLVDYEELPDNVRIEIGDDLIKKLVHYGCYSELKGYTQSKKIPEELRRKAEEKLEDAVKDAFSHGHNPQSHRDIALDTSLSLDLRVTAAFSFICRDYDFKPCQYGPYYDKLIELAKDERISDEIKIKVTEMYLHSWKPDYWHHYCSLVQISNDAQMPDKIRAEAKKQLNEHVTRVCILNTQQHYYHSYKADDERILSIIANPAVEHSLRVAVGEKLVLRYQNNLNYTALAELMENENLPEEVRLEARAFLEEKL